MFSWSISAAWAETTALARVSTSGRSVRGWMARAMAMPAVWWVIIRLRKTVSASSPEEDFSLARSAGVAIPGIRPSWSSIEPGAMVDPVGMVPMSCEGLAAIQVIGGWVEVCGSRHMLQPGVHLPGLLLLAGDDVVGHRLQGRVGRLVPDD